MLYQQQNAEEYTRVLPVRVYNEAADVPLFIEMTARQQTMQTGYQ